MTSRTGLTLIELVVALTITGLVMITGYSALSTLVDHRDRVVAATDSVTTIAGKRQLLVDLLRGAQLNISGQAKFEGIGGVDHDLPDDALTFVTNAPTPADANQTLVRVYIDREEKTPERGLMMEIADTRGDPGKRIELDPRVSGLEIRYLSGVFGKRTWLDSWVSTTVLPSAVRLSFVSAQNDSVPPLLRVPIIVPLGTVQ
jgi:prepilin-type N-terminal cleavage/methylation domain-containing protein